jgi:hypothetical protein
MNADIIPDVIAWIAAEAERPRSTDDAAFSQREQNRQPDSLGEPKFSIDDLPAHQFPSNVFPSSQLPANRPNLPGTTEPAATVKENVIEASPAESQPPQASLDQQHLGLMEQAAESRDDERERRIYRGRTVAMLRRYMRYSIETGRLPSLLGREFFRAQVTSYGVSTFEDRVIFVHDMEICLDRLDEFSRQLIARHILQEHDRWATARLLHCNEKTVRRCAPLVLDTLSEILLDVGLLQRIDSTQENSCQGGMEDEDSVSDCEDEKNKF